MKREDCEIWLWEVDGVKRRWTVKFRPLPAPPSEEYLPNYARARLDTRELIINSRVRNRKAIRDTIIHEAQHIAFGNIVAETPVQRAEGNASDLLDACGFGTG